MSLKARMTIGAAILGVVLIFVFSTKYDTKEIDILSAQVDVKITAQDLLSRLVQENQKSLGSLKPDQIFEVTGRLKEINMANGRLTILLKGNSDLPPYIICDMISQQKSVVSVLRPNDSVIIKGIFKGFLKDAVFLDCIITYSQTNE